MSATTKVWAVFAALLLATSVTVTAGIWTGDERWLWTSCIPGALTLINLCFLPAILNEAQN